jgi:hypothetical protein
VAEYEPTSRRPIAQTFRRTAEAAQFDSSGATVASAKKVRDSIEPTLTPATFGSVKATHITSDILTIAALWAMEFRRRRLRDTAPTA